MKRLLTFILCALISATALYGAQKKVKFGKTKQVVYYGETLKKTPAGIGSLSVLSINPSIMDELSGKFSGETLTDNIVDGTLSLYATRIGDGLFRKNFFRGVIEYHLDNTSVEYVLRKGVFTFVDDKCSITIPEDSPIHLWRNYSSQEFQIDGMPDFLEKDIVQVPLPDCLKSTIFEKALGLPFEYTHTKYIASHEDHYYQVVEGIDEDLTLCRNDLGIKGKITKDENGTPYLILARSNGDNFVANLSKPDSYQMFSIHGDTYELSYVEGSSKKMNDTNDTFMPRGPGIYTHDSKIYPAGEYSMMFFMVYEKAMDGFDSEFKGWDYNKYIPKVNGRNRVFQILYNNGDEFYGYANLKNSDGKLSKINFETWMNVPKQTAVNLVTGYKTAANGSKTVYYLEGVSTTSLKSKYKKSGTQTAKQQSGKSTSDKAESGLKGKFNKWLEKAKSETPGYEKQSGFHSYTVKSQGDTNFHSH